jgi:quinol monooxygenase YgiN
MNRYGMFGKITPEEGKRDELARILLEAADAMDTLEECDLYVVSVNEEENAIWVTEVWKDAEAHKASLSMDSIRTLIQRGRPLIAEMETIQTFTVLGGKGLS